MPRSTQSKAVTNAAVDAELEKMAAEAEEELSETAQEVVEAGPLLQKLLAKQLPPVLKIKPVRLNKTPVTAHQGDAGLDLEFAPADGKSRIVRPGSVEMMETGIKVAIPEGHAGLVLPRSGMASKRGLRPVNTPGLIDSGYRGEIFVPLESVIDRQIVTAGERIAQLVIVPLSLPTIEVVDELDETERGDGGFGSTD